MAYAVNRWFYLWFNRNGGINNCGTLFRYNLIDNTAQKLVDFSLQRGKTPSGAVTLASNGKLYGITDDGGDAKLGVLFEYDPTNGNYVKKRDIGKLTNGFPNGSLVRANNGKYYGIGNKYYTGVHSPTADSLKTFIFEYDYNTDSNIRKIDVGNFVAFNLAGYNLLEVDSNILYGFTGVGGQNNGGMIFKYDVLTNVFVNLYDMVSLTGINPVGGFVRGQGKKLYGITKGGGVNGHGVIFEFDAESGIYTKKIDLNSTITGSNPSMSLVLASNGKFYGVTSSGAQNGYGGLFEYDQNIGTILNKISFSSGKLYSSIVEAPNQKIYGIGPCGMFSYDYIQNLFNPTNYNPLFYATECSYPSGGLFLSSNNKLYGMIRTAGDYRAGLIFEYDYNTGVSTKKIDFNGMNGALPSLNNFVEHCISPPAAAVEIFGDSAICSGTSRLYSVAPVPGATSYTWALPSGWIGTSSSNIIQAQFGAVGGQISVTANNACGSSIVTNRMVNIGTAPTVVPNTSSNLICSGEAIILSGSGAISYSWSNGVTNGVSHIPLATNTYTVVGTDNIGCNDTATILITIKPTPTVIASSSTVCTGQSATVFASGADTYVWNNGTIGSSCTFNNVNTTTSYTVIGQSSINGCSDTINGNILVYSYPIVSMPNDTNICSGTSISLNPIVTSNPGNLVFGNFSSRTIPDNNLTGVSSSITVSGFIGSVGNRIASVKININHTWDADLGIYLECPNGTRIELSTYNGGDANNYTNTVFATSGQNITTGLAPFTGTFMPEQSFGTLSNSDINGIWKLVVIDVATGDVGTLFNWTLTFTNPLNYSWTPSLGLSTTNTLGTIATPTITTDYTFTVSEEGGCSNSSNILVSVNSPVIIPQANKTLICVGDSLILTAIGADSYTWSDGVINEEFFIPTNPNTYTVTGIDSIGCSSDSTIFINISSSPIPIVIANSTNSVVCLGDQISLFGAGANSYSWNNGVTDGVAFNIIATDTFMVTGIDLNGCEGVDTITINVNQLPNIFINTNDNFICIGDSVVLNGTGANSYSWSGSVTDGVSFIPTISDTYSVTGTDANNCSNTASVVITVNPLPIVIASTTDSIPCYGTSIVLSGSGADSYSWSNGILDGVSFTVANSENYFVTGIDINGCIGMDSIRITIDSCNMVWPGDANYDGIANNNDLLELGLRYGSVGTARSIVSNNWQNYLSANWATDTVSTGYNLKHADCNGDGTINLDDTLAINLNYGLTHALRLADINKTNTTGDIYFASAQLGYGAGQQVAIDVYLGESTNPLQNFYGAAFTIDYNDNTLVQPGSLSYSIDDASWVGTINTDAIRLTKPMEGIETIDAAICKTNHINTSGAGKIGTLRFIASNTIGNFSVTASNAYYIDNAAIQTPLTSATYTVNINTAVGLQNQTSNSNISIYPNPNNGTFTLSNLNTREEYKLEVKDVLGRTVYTDVIKSNSSNANIKLNQAAGVYWLQIRSKQGGVEVHKVVVE